MRVSNMFVTFLAILIWKSTEAISCIHCPASSSNHQCNLQATVEICAANQDACFVETRKHGGVYSIRKGCSQSLSCKVQSDHNKDLSSFPGEAAGLKRCNEGYDNSVCQYCCSHDNCNLAEKPRPNSRRQSCFNFFPVCRAAWWDDRTGILTDEGRFLGCHCDRVCLTKNDCCFDYKEVCLGVLPPSLRSLDIYGGATGGEYSKVVPRGGGLPLLRCFVCHEMKSNEECNRLGTIQECEPNQRSCMTETRQHEGRMLISKRCSHQQSCAALQRASPCDGGDACYSCCNLNYCNVFKKPHETNFSTSCLTAFPGFPRCKRASLSSCSGNTARCSQGRCNCDANCATYRDCCDDYAQLCSSPETANMEWIFEEILRSNSGTGNAGQGSRV